MPLTDLEVRNAKSKGKRYTICDGNGLNLEVRPTGSKAWYIRYRENGREKTLVLGSYPTMLERKRVQPNKGPSCAQSFNLPRCRAGMDGKAVRTLGRQTHSHGQTKIGSLAISSDRLEATEGDNRARATFRPTPNRGQGAN